MYHLSASQVGTWRQCQRRYCFEYIEKDKAPPSKSQQFGTDVHKHLEDWLKRNKVPDHSAAGQTARQGLQWLPAPRPELIVEKKFELQWSADVVMVGYIDCHVPPDVSELGMPLVVDHKTTSDLRWAKDIAALEHDPQALIYAVYSMRLFNASQVTARWVYYSASNPPSGKRRPKGSKPVEAVFDLNDHMFVTRVNLLDNDVGAICEARREKRAGLDALPSPGACGMYGGCYHQNKCELTTGERFAAYLNKNEKE